MALFPNWASLDAYVDVPSVQAYYKVDDNVWGAVVAQLGDPGNDLRFFAATPHTAVVYAVSQAFLPDGSSLSAIQATQVGLMWRLARMVVAHNGGLAESNFVDIDPWKVVESEDSKPSGGGDTAARGPGASMSSSVKERVLKMSSLVDQMDESELLPPEVDQVNKWHTSYIMAMGALPEECEEPSAAQLAALNKRVQSGQPPYVDFAVWLPYGRRSERSHKFRVYVPLGNGEIQVREQPGPANFQAWTASWRVFKAAAIMLDIISMASLSRYEKAIERLVLQWPACWGLVGAAEDKARSERWMRLHRKTIADRDAGKPVPRDWTINKPWSALMVELSMDLEFWTEHVHIPATAWMANGQRGAPRVAAEDAILHHLPLGTVDGVPGDKDDPGGPHRKKQANRDRRLAKRKRLADEREELIRLRKGAHTGQVNPGKGGGKGKTKDQTGEPLCYSWAGKFGPCASVPVGGKCLCTVKRTHKCRKCLSPAHQDADCPARSG